MHVVASGCNQPRQSYRLQIFEQYEAFQSLVHLGTIHHLKRAREGNLVCGEVIDQISQGTVGHMSFYESVAIVLLTID